MIESLGLRVGVREQPKETNGFYVMQVSFLEALKTPQLYPSWGILWDRFLYTAKPIVWAVRVSRAEGFHVRN